MDTLEKLEWSAPEYEEKEHSQDWFWALGVIIVTGSITSIIFGSYFFAALLVLGGGMLGFFAVRKPEIINHELNNRGLKIRTTLYPYENIKSFWVQTNEPGKENQKPMFFIRSERFFMPVISMPIDISQADDIRAIMLSMGVPEQEMREHLSEKIMESLGF